MEAIQQTANTLPIMWRGKTTKKKGEAIDYRTYVKSIELLFKMKGSGFLSDEEYEYLKGRFEGDCEGKGQAPANCPTAHQESVREA